MLCFSATSTRNVFIKIKYKKKISAAPPVPNFYQTATGSTGIFIRLSGVGFINEVNLLWARLVLGGG